MRIIPLTLVSLQPLVLSDNIHTCSFASLIHRFVRLQLSSPLAYNNAQLFEPRFFQLSRHNTICVFASLKKIHYQLCRHNTKTRFQNSPQPIMWTYSVMYIYSSFSLSILSPIAYWCLKHCSKLRLCLHSRIVFGSLLQRTTVSVNIMHKSYIEELSIYRGLKKLTR